MLCVRQNVIHCMMILIRLLCWDQYLQFCFLLILRAVQFLRETGNLQRYVRNKIINTVFFQIHWHYDGADALVVFALSSYIKTSTYVRAVKCGLTEVRVNFHFAQYQRFAHGCAWLLDPH